MNWHKTNLCLILILCIIDVFLAITLYNTYKKTEFIPEALVEEAFENLSARGIHFDKEKTDTKKYQKSVYLYSSDLVYAEEMKAEAKESYTALISAIAHISGIPESSDPEQIQYFDIPGGTSVSVTDHNGKVLGSAIIEGMTGFEYTSADFDPTSLEKIIEKDRGYASCSAKPMNLPSSLISFFDKVYGGTVSGKAVHISEHDSGKVVTTILCADGIYVHNMILSFYIKSGKILYVSGDMFFSEPKKDTTVNITDGINILFNLPENTFGTVSVTSQHLEYALFETSRGNNYLVPAWIISYLSDDNDGKEEHIILNAITGNVLDRVIF